MVAHDGEHSRQWTIASLFGRPERRTPLLAFKFGPYARGHDGIERSFRVRHTGIYLTRTHLFDCRNRFFLFLQPEVGLERVLNCATHTRQRQPSAGATCLRMDSITCALYSTPSWLGTVSSSVSASAMASSALSSSISRSGSAA